MRRIVILGVTGSGKTTFGKKLSERLCIPATDLDDLHWLPGWKQREPADFRARAAEKSAAEDWIIIGNYSKVRDAVWPRADAFIWLDYPFLRVFRQLVWRCIRRVIDKNEVCNGNVENLRNLFSKDSLILWLFRSYSRRKREYGAFFDAAGNSPAVAYIRLRSPKEAEDFLNNAAKRA